MDVMIWDPTERLLGGVAITLGFITGLLYIIRRREKTDPHEKFVLMGFACLIWAATTLFTIFYLIEFLVPGNFTNFVFLGDYTKAPLLYNLIHDVGWVIFFILYSVLILAFERVIKKSKYILTIILWGLIFICIVSLIYDLPFNFVFYTYTYLGLIVPILILILIRWAKAELKATMGFFLIAIMLVATTITLLESYIKQFEFLPLFFPYLTAIVGWVFGIIPLYLNKVEPRKVWIYYIVIVFLGYLFIIIISLITKSLEYFIGFTLFFAASLYAGIDTLRFFSSRTPEMALRKEKSEVLKVFSRRERVTEEEVSISKEKKICLVCKSNISEHTYVCYDCQSFYCQKCYNALVDLENSCWACNVALDKSKPVKTEEKEEELLVEQEEHKPAPKK